MWLTQWELEGKSIEKLELLNLENEKVTLALNDKKPRILVFWATWCGPCKIEMSRLKSAVESKELNGQLIYAISSGETAQVIKKSLEKQSYPFQMMIDPEYKASQFFDVHVTPTVVHINGDGKIVYITSGLSATTVYRAKNHLNQ